MAGWAGPWADRGAGLGSGAAPQRQSVPGGRRRRDGLAARAAGRTLVGRGAVRLMGFNNPPMTWRDLERTLSTPEGKPFPAQDVPVSWRRHPYVARPIEPPEHAVPYAELHAHSSFSFLDGASGPAELAEEAERLGLHALAITDHDGFYGIVRFAEAAESLRLKTVFGAELSLELPAPQKGQPDPAGSHLLVLAAARRATTGSLPRSRTGQLAGGEKGRPGLRPRRAGRARRWALGGVHRLPQGRRAAGAGRRRARAVPGGNWPTWCTCSGRARLRRADRPRPAARLVPQRRARRARRRAAAADDRDRQRPLRHARRSTRWRRPSPPCGPTAASTSSTAGCRAAGTRSCAPGRRWQRGSPATPAPSRAPSRSPTSSPSRCGAPSRHCPSRRCPPGTRRCRGCGTWSGRRCRAGTRSCPTPTRERIERELAVIEPKDFPGYFLIVHDIVAEAKRRGILCQGRGSAANSRRLLPARHHGGRLDRLRAAVRAVPLRAARRGARHRRRLRLPTVARRSSSGSSIATAGSARRRSANVIQYRPKNAIRDMAKALGLQPRAAGCLREAGGGLGSDRHLRSRPGDSVIDGSPTP